MNADWVRGVVNGLEFGAEEDPGAAVLKAELARVLNRVAVSSAHTEQEAVEAATMDDMSDHSERIVRLEEWMKHSEQARRDFQEEMRAGFARMETNVQSLRTDLSNEMRSDRAAVQADIKASRFATISTVIGTSLAVVGLIFAMIQSSVSSFDVGREFGEKVEQAQKAAEEAKAAAASSTPPSGPAIQQKRVKE